MFFYLLLTLLLLVLGHTLWKNRNLPPGPWGIPLLGYLPWLSPKAPYVTLTELSKKYGSVYSLTLGSVCTVVLTDPKDIKSLFAKDATTGRAPLYLTHGIMNGYGLICAEGDLWKDQRRFVHNCIRTLGGSKIGQQRHKMENLILKHVESLVEYLKTTNGEPLDPLESLRHHLGSVINEIVFGTYWPKDDPTWIWLQELQEEGIKHIGVAGPLNFLPFLRFLPTFKRPMSFLIEGKLKTHRFYQKLIEEEKQKLLLSEQSRSDGDLDTNNAYTSLLQGFLIEKVKKSNSESACKYYNDQQFYHLLADVFGAGLDTTLTTLRWLILYLALNEDIQEKVRQEILSVTEKRTPTMDDITYLSLVEACIAETQRIRSVVPVGIPHGALADIPLNNYIIPKGSMIIPLQWAIHMNKIQYKNPEMFNPNNFLDKDGKFCKNEHFIPFQSGKRMCVGDELAKMLLSLFIVRLLQNFTFMLEDKQLVDTEGDCGITLTPKPFKIRFKTL
ncbi:cytochrome P450 306a1 [Anthonomus grandis grandis]|uniref:cytochrome P450 306a1 n=1 Tax=Anthonomus grandis grandis TaxID=2921223 RepID=UPI00216615C8|nr:cytochrome P450 306a1 [Anthonomus grandis grandis]